MRGSRRTLATFWKPSTELITTWVPSVSTQVSVVSGDPSGMTVATTQRFGPRRRDTTSSGRGSACGYARLIGRSWSSGRVVAGETTVGEPRRGLAATPGSAPSVPEGEHRGGERVEVVAGGDGPDLAGGEEPRDALGTQAAAHRVDVVVGVGEHRPAAPVAREQQRAGGR